MSNSNPMASNFLCCFFFSFTFLVSYHPLLGDHTGCDSPWSCNSTGPLIQFPFYLKDQQSDRCGYPGFQLSCNNRSQTILTLPSSGQFVVKGIDYLRRAIYINDPRSCLPHRIKNFSLQGSPFSGTYFASYVFVNCSSSWTAAPYPAAVPMPCLRRGNHTVYAMDRSQVDWAALPATCVQLRLNDSVSGMWSVSQSWSLMTPRGNLRLTWTDPCLTCAARGLVCGVSDQGEVTCSTAAKRVLPRSIKYLIILGGAIPALLFIIGIAGFTYGRIRVNRLRHRINTELSASIRPQPAVSVQGLDGAIIESLPKTVLGESGRLPKPNHDTTCPICLCEYQPRETLRTLPECDHYFHANCIDEWLKLNGTCPLCRNSPESVLMTPCSSMSSSTFYASS